MLTARVAQPKSTTNSCRVVESVNARSITHTKNATGKRSLAHKSVMVTVPKTRTVGVALTARIPARAFAARRDIDEEVDEVEEEEGEYAEEGQESFDIRGFVQQAGVSKREIDEIVEKLEGANFNESTLEKVNDKFLRQLGIVNQAERFNLLKASNDYLQSVKYKKRQAAKLQSKSDIEDIESEVQEEDAAPSRSARTRAPVTYETDNKPWDLRKFLESAKVESENMDAIYDALKEDGFDDSKFAQLSNRYLKELRIPSEEIPGIIRASKKWARPLKPGKLNPGYERRSPSESATNYEHGFIRVGNDGQPWVVKISSDGVRRWRPFKVELF